MDRSIDRSIDQSTERARLPARGDILVGPIEIQTDAQTIGYHCPLGPEGIIARRLISTSVVASALLTAIVPLDSPLVDRSARIVCNDRDLQNSRGCAPCSLSCSSLSCNELRLIRSLRFRGRHLFSGGHNLLSPRLTVLQSTSFPCLYFHQNNFPVNERKCVSRFLKLATGRVRVRSSARTQLGHEHRAIEMEPSSAKIRFLMMSPTSYRLDDSVFDAVRPSR